MLRPTIFIAISLLLLAVYPAWASTTSEPILIVEVQTASSASATDEFVEIINSANHDVDVTGWQLQYKSATGTDWSVKATLNGLLPSRHRYLLATDFIESSHTIKSGFAAGGGHIRIANSRDETVDQVGWGTAESADAAAALAPSGGETLKRSIDEDGFFIDSDDNSSDFFISPSPSPTFDPIVVVDQPVVQAEEAMQQNTTSTPPKKDAPTNIMITELFIDPQKPLTDAEDEYVELYNPNNYSVSLSGFVIKTGSGGRYSYTVPSITLKPGEYKALFSIDTGLTLSNSGGIAALFAPTESMIFETEAYEKAEKGESWTAVGGEWVWAPPSPGSASKAVIAEEAELADRSDLITQNTVSEDSDDEEDTTTRSIYEEPEASSTQSINTTVLAGVGAIAVLYAGYEYRHDAANRINQLREYVRNRRENRAKS